MIKNKHKKMKTSEAIKELQKLVEENGDAELHIYLSYSKQTISQMDIAFDDEEKDIIIGVYG